MTTTHYTIHDYADIGIALTTTDADTANRWSERGKRVTAVTTV
jgi:hypothetical protein